ncbi:MAG: DUF2061 domain-containing protein [Pseudomonadota bacterium]|nr:DUF2061 domain-containing protein [Pseudomonadota bacterium]
MLKPENPVYRESHLRSIFKALSWRLVATCTTFAIVYLITGKTAFAISIAGVEVVTKMIIYYLHERAWQLLPRGSVRKLLKK